MTRTAAKSTAEAAKLLRTSFAALAKADALPAPERATLHERVDRKLAALPHEPWIFGVLDEIIGKSEQRRRDSIHALVVLADLPEGRRRLSACLIDQDARARTATFAIIGERRWTELAPLLEASLRREKDPAARHALLFACGALHAPVLVPPLLRLATADLARPSDDRHGLLVAFVKLADERTRPYLSAIFADKGPGKNASAQAQRQHKEDRVLAAWGLCALGKAPTAQRHLVSMLDEAPAKPLYPGVPTLEASVADRAAQALGAIMGLVPAWQPISISRVKAALS